VLAVSYALRMVADSAHAVSFLRWCSPLGWIEELQPLTSPRPLALLPIAAWTLACGTAAVLLAGRRDVGASIFADRTSAPARTALLGGPLGLAWRTTRAALALWAAGLGLFALLLGLIAHSAGAALTASPSLARVFARLGATGANSYLGIAFLLSATLLALLAATEVAAMGREESAGYCAQLVVRVCTRRRWYLARSGLVALSLAAGGLLTGLLAAAGGALGGAHVGVSGPLCAGIAIVAPALVVLGAGGLAFGGSPRHTSAVVYGLVAWSVLVDLLGSVASLNHLVSDTSVLHQLDAAPAVGVDWASTGVLVVLALSGVVGGGLLFSRRDLAGD
jgi:ABC-2 type transport system permease protein